MIKKVLMGLVYLVVVFLLADTSVRHSVKKVPDQAMSAEKYLSYYDVLKNERLIRGADNRKIWFKLSGSEADFSLEGAVESYIFDKSVGGRNGEVVKGYNFFDGNLKINSVGHEPYGRSIILKPNQKADELYFKNMLKFFIAPLYLTYYEIKNRAEDIEKYSDANTFAGKMFVFKEYLFSLVAVGLMWILIYIGLYFGVVWVVSRCWQETVDDNLKAARGHEGQEPETESIRKYKLMSEEDVKALKRKGLWYIIVLTMPLYLAITNALVFVS